MNRRRCIAAAAAAFALALPAGLGAHEGGGGEGGGGGSGGGGRAEERVPPETPTYMIVPAAVWGVAITAVGWVALWRRTRADGYGGTVRPGT